MTTQPPPPTFLPPGSQQPAGRPLRPLDLAQPKTLGELLTAAWRIWRARPAVFLTISLVVAFLPLAALGVASAALGHDGTLSEETNGADAVANLLQYTLITWLVSATHANALVALASGEDITWRAALARGGAALGAVAVAALLAFVFTLLGVVLFIIGAIWIGVLVVFSVTIAAVTEQRGLAAVRASRELVSEVGWWSTFGQVFAINALGAIVAIIPTMLIGIGVGIFAMVVTNSEDAVDYPLAVVLAAMQAGVMSWTALATTLLYFSHRAHAGEPWQPPAGSTPAVDLVLEPIPGMYGGGYGAPGPTFVKHGHTPPPAPPPPDQPPRFVPPSEHGRHGAAGLPGDAPPASGLPGDGPPNADEPRA